MKPEFYRGGFEPGSLAGVSAQMNPVAPAVTATRIKGEEITELKAVVVGRKPDMIRLDLTPEAAGVLLQLMGCITGPDYGPRGITSRIYYALKNTSGVRDGYRRLNARNGHELAPIWIQ